MRAHKYDAPRKVIGLLPEGKNERSYKSKVFCSCNKTSLCKRKCECPSAGEFCGSSYNVFPINVLTEKQAMPWMITRLGQRERDPVSRGIRLLESAHDDILINTVER